jgi:hypothetical protein
MKLALIANLCLIVLLVYVQPLLSTNVVYLIINVFKLLIIFNLYYI